MIASPFCRATCFVLVTLGIGDGRALATLRQDPPAAEVPRDPALDAALKFVKQGKGDDALAEIRKAAGSHPDWPPPLLVLARMLFAVNQAESGRLALEEASAESPEDPSIPLAFAAIDLTEGRRHDAKLNADLALRLAGELKDTAPAVRHEAHKVLASVAESRRDWETARRELLATLEIRPRDGTSRQALGRILFLMGRTDEAYDALKAAVGDDPRLEPAEVSMALLSSQKGAPEKAVEWFERAREAHPKEARPRIAYALWLMDHGRVEVALPLAEEALALEPSAIEPKKLRALVAFHLRDLIAAEAAYENLHHALPDEAGITNLLALSLVDQEDKAKRARGLQLAEALARQHPRSPEILGALGHAHDRNGHPQDAEVNLRAAVAGGKATPDTTYFLALLLVERGRADEARRLLMALTNPPRAFAYRKEARVLLDRLPAASK